MKMLGQLPAFDFPDGVWRPKSWGWDYLAPGQALYFIYLKYFKNLHQESCVIIQIIKAQTRESSLDTTGCPCRRQLYPEAAPSAQPGWEPHWLSVNRARVRALPLPAAGAVSCYKLVNTPYLPLNWIWCSLYGCASYLFSVWLDIYLNFGGSF